MKPALRLLLLSLFVAAFGRAQQITSDPLVDMTFSPTELQEDLDLYVGMLRETHPGLYRYQTKAEFDNRVKLIQQAIERGTDFYSFFKRINELSASIRCAHTQVYPKRDVLAHIRQDAASIPLYVYPVEDKLYVLFSGLDNDTVLPGYEVLAVNDRSFASIREDIDAYHFRDGNGISMIRKYLQGAFFCMTMYYAVDQGPEYKVTFGLPDGSTKTLTLPGQPYSVTERNLVGNPVNKEILAYYNSRSNKNFDLEILDELPNTAQIRFSSFGGKKVNYEEQAQKKMRQFMDKSIKKMKKAGVEHLILELRGNLGGWDIMGGELLSYFVPEGEEVSYYREQIAITKDSEFLANSDLDPADLGDADLYLIAKDDGTYALNPQTNALLRPIKGKPNGFKGKLYLLVDEQTASSTAEFVAAIRSNDYGTIVGTESGGAYGGGNSGSFIELTLPNSGIFTKSPLLRYEMAVKPVQDPARGTLPDQTTYLNLEDLLSGYDRQKELVYELIRKGQE